MTTLIAITDQTPVPPPQPRLRPHPGRRARLAATVVMAVGSAVLLFARLGHYAPWDDEAITAMTARAVWQTGDTSVRVDDHNLLVYRNGLLVRDFKDRFTPPLQFYVLAPFIGTFGDGNWAIRLPFALCGAGTVAILLRWAWRSLRPVPVLWWAAAFLLLTNFELFLFCRQCRYYGLAIVLTTAAAYLYTFRSGRTRGIAGLSAVLAALLAAQYLNYAAAVGCLVVDYAVWGRRDRRITWPQWAVVVVPQLVVGGVACSIWNPVARQAVAGVAAGGHHWFVDHRWLLWLNARDWLASGFVVLPLVLACPLLRLKRRSTWLVRGPIAMGVYVVVVSLTVATPAATASTAEVRYLAPLLPVCLATAALGVWGTLALRPRPRLLVLVAAALTVLVNTSIGHDGPPVTCDPAAFYAELIHPQAEPYTPTIAWVNDHVPAGASVYVSPAWMAYPLMFRAPRPTYAWQLPDPPRADLAGAPAVHVRGRVVPDYLIRFGSSAETDPMAAAMADLARRGVRYDLVHTVPVYWHDMYRPERVWRSFVTHPPATGESVYIYRRRG